MKDLGFNIEPGPRGLVGRGGVREAAPARATPDGIIVPRGISADGSVLLAAADLDRRGYAVFLPLNPDRARCDLVAIDERDRVEQIVVTKKPKGGKEVRYDTPEHERKMRRALVLTDQPVQYEPALRKARDT